MIVQHVEEGSSPQNASHDKILFQFSQSILLVIKGRGKVDYITSEAQAQCPSINDLTYWKLDNSIEPHIQLYLFVPSNY